MYRFVIAEGIANWVLTPHITKPSFEDHTGDLTPDGELIAQTALAAIRQKCDVLDLSFSTFSNSLTTEHTMIFARGETIENLIKVATEAVTTIC